MIWDFKDPDDEQGRTYREINNATKHTHSVGELVELHEDGEQLFIMKLTRDWDGAPLYNLGEDGETTA